MSLILCYCEKCGQTNAISDTELDNIKEEKCVNCDTIGYYKVVPKEYLTDLLQILTKCVGIGEKHLKKYKNIIMSYLKMTKLNKRMFQSALLANLLT